MTVATFPAPASITLGTVQLGMAYGRVVETQPPDHETRLKMLDLAVQEGVSCIDTAAAYGDAETAIGDWLRMREPAALRPTIVTKLAALHEADGRDYPAAIRRRIEDSQDRMGLQRIDGCLVHRPSDMLMPGVAETLRALVDEGSVSGFGVSVYDASELEHALTVEGVALIQAPHSLFDRRIAQSGLLAECEARGIMVFARSVFLQGVAFLKPEQLPAGLAALAPPLAMLNELANSTGLSIAALCLGAALAEPGVSSVVIGASNPTELAANLEAGGTCLDPDLLAETHAIAAGLDEAVLDPRRWP